ncbi:hypothetical protein acsn021_18250 [Anaerocolumna cellulosilytica]|uniref:Uncharacterized protein n=1 Tax=Anaerocolumna cellulosilytica TaxID=433286 RepID=A0A6S6QX09_9FIRM|nr:DUF1961 family protein [Anaerocolumna cellulosilytica]MBB5194781.1 hypothetical protein [Anaerocolumna cellulosilytica]BCJ94256.1 hypothetical protein acsn021_18250 [Anaerocolumna cellulosilytica]
MQPFNAPIPFIKETLLYENALKEKEDIQNFILEGQAKICFDNQCMILKNALDNGLGQKANYVLWCPEIFPANIKITWEFRPVTDVGLCILFFGAGGKEGKDLFDTTLTKRTGEYPQYHSGDINAFHISYFRRKEPDERAFHTCNLRKSFGFHLVAQGADPLPSAKDCVDFYKMEVIKYKNTVAFSINGLVVFTYEDDGDTYGPLLTEGRIGFRQLAPLTAAYRNLKIFELNEYSIEAV